MFLRQKTSEYRQCSRDQQIRANACAGVAARTMAGSKFVVALPRSFCMRSMKDAACAPAFSLLPTTMGKDKTENIFV